ncbi:sulfatase family protein [Paenibacillus cremeus]|uniref:Sulfatase-like hydrolase/transferase n=1 Tax=Paenibacillus cremeus TaxID=2163881 RepID=A0A559KGC6_9BACL|nr:sulfatase-like hydrolase/transferase [Paenibacillus cremeus]TVY11180.1 sulfatase-like hydrolase/transferase [Paenibacillus cremeus]
MSQRPNILLLLSDQHSPHVLGRAGNALVRTPNLDRLAEEGMYFEQAYCQNPLCVPSRASLITGQYSRNVGIYDNKHILEANCATIPRVLGAQGYRTCLIGKMHFNGDQFHGFQQRPYGDLFGQAHQPDPYRTPDESGLGDIVKTTGPSGIPLPLTQTEICVAEAAKWLQIHVAQHREKPFFLSVNFDKPHFPIKAPRNYYEYYEGRVELPQVPENALDRAVPFVRNEFYNNKTGLNSKEDQLRALAAYYGCVEWVDDAIGRLLETLDYLGLAENTIVIYTSDHGEMGGEHGTWQKFLFFDASARVPFIIRWPNTIQPGSKCSQPIGLIDLFPTLAEAAQCPVPDTCDGVSLLPLWEDQPLKRDAIFSETVILVRPELAGCMIRTGPWKYSCYLDGSEELYNLEADLDEWNNLASEGHLQSLKQSLKQRVIEFWEPQKQLERYHNTPKMRREKHFYPYSNQFLLSDGTIVDGRP